MEKKYMEYSANYIAHNKIKTKKGEDMLILTLSLDVFSYGEYRTKTQDYFIGIENLDLLEKIEKFQTVDIVYDISNPLSVPRFEKIKI